MRCLNSCPKPLSKKKKKKKKKKRNLNTSAAFTVTKLASHLFIPWKKYWWSPCRNLALVNADQWIIFICQRWLATNFCTLPQKKCNFNLRVFFLLTLVQGQWPLVMCMSFVMPFKHQILKSYTIGWLYQKAGIWKSPIQHISRMWSPNSSQMYLWKNHKGFGVGIRV